MYKIIGVSGRIGNGKDTVAEYLQSAYGFKNVKFARKLKDSVYILNPYVRVTGLSVLARLGFENTTFVRFQDLIDCVGEEDAKLEEEVRRLYQVFGTDVGRVQYGEDFWVEQMELPNDSNVVISDLRFDNEAEFVKSKGGSIWNVTRDTESTSNHVSETGLCSEYIDVELDNNSTIEDLYTKIDNILK